jgi:NADH-ubiquinone oxidoreductase chain 4
MPLFLVHLWLPKAHVEAPVAGSIVLAGVLLKLGSYGLVRVCYMFNYVNYSLVSSVVIGVAIYGGVLTRAVCIRQIDLKALVAYSSIGHIAVLAVGVISGFRCGFAGGFRMIIAHGMCSSGLFFMGSVLYEMYGRRSIFLVKGVLGVIPVISIWWFLFLSVNMSAPPRLNFMSEVFLIMSVVSRSVRLILPLALMGGFTCAYSLVLYSRVNHGLRREFSNLIRNLRVVKYVVVLIHFVPVILLSLKLEIFMLWL